MTIQKQLAVLKAMLPGIQTIFRAQMCPLDRPMILLRDGDGNEWWLHVHQVGLFAPATGQKPGEKPDSSKGTKQAPKAKRSSKPVPEGDLKLF